ncbi:hypothetical protein IWQ62_002360, partial [Dispira parvispora]
MRPTVSRAVRAALLSTSVVRLRHGLDFTLLCVLNKQFHGLQDQTLSLLPFVTPLRIRTSQSPLHHAWKGPSSPAEQRPGICTAVSQVRWYGHIIQPSNTSYFPTEWPTVEQLNDYRHQIQAQWNDALNQDCPLLVWQVHQTWCDRKLMWLMDNAMYRRILAWYVSRYLPVLCNQDPQVRFNPSQLVPYTSATHPHRTALDQLCNIIQHRMELTSLLTTSSIPLPPHVEPLVTQPFMMSIDYLKSLTILGMPGQGQHILHAIECMLKQSYLPSQKITGRLLAVLVYDAAWSMHYHLLSKLRLAGFRHTSASLGLAFQLLVSRGEIEPLRTLTQFLAEADEYVPVTVLERVPTELPPTVPTEIIAFVANYALPLAPRMAQRPLGHWIELLRQHGLRELSRRWYECIRQAGITLHHRTLDIFHRTWDDTPQFRETLDRDEKCNLLQTRSPAQVASQVLRYCAEAKYDRAEPAFQSFCTVIERANAIACYSLFQGLIRIGRLTWALDLYWRMVPPAPPALSTHHVALLNALIKHRRCVMASNIYHHIRRHQLTLSPTATVTLLHALAIDKQVEYVRDLYSTIQKDLPELGTGQQIRAITALTTVGLLPEAFGLLEQCTALRRGILLDSHQDKPSSSPVAIDNSGSSLTQSLLHVLLNACAKYGDTTRFFRLYEVLTRRNIQYDAVTYTVLMRAFIGFGQPRRALHLLSEMSMRKVFPNAVTYLTLVSELSQHGYHGMVEQLFRSLRDEQRDQSVHTTAVLADRSLLNKFLFEFGRRQAWDLVADVKRWMAELGVAPDGTTVATRMAYHDIHGHYKRVYQIFQEANRDQLTLPDWGYITVIRALEHLGRSQETVDLLGNIRARNGFYVKDHHLVSLIQCLSRFANLQALDILWEIFHALYLMKRDNIIMVFTAFIQAYDHLRAAHRVQHLWDVMVTHPIRPNQTTLSVLIDACRFHPTLRPAYILKWANSQDVSLNTNNFTSLIEYYCIMGQPDLAYQVLTQDIPQCGVSLDQKLLRNYRALLSPDEYPAHVVE